VLVSVENWFEFDNKLQINLTDLDFYYTIVGIEIAAELFFTMMGVLIFKALLSRRKSMVEVDYRKEFKKVFTERMQIIINF